MKVITGDRGTGKTAELIKESAKTGAYIVVSNRHIANYVAQMAKDLNLQIRFPITFDELFHGSLRTKGLANIHLLIDDVDSLINKILGHYWIDSITCNTEPGNYLRLEPK